MGKKTKKSNRLRDGLKSADMVLSVRLERKAGKWTVTPLSPTRITAPIRVPIRLEGVEAFSAALEALRAKACDVSRGFAAKRRQALSGLLAPGYIVDGHYAADSAKAAGKLSGGYSIGGHVAAECPSKAAGESPPVDSRDQKIKSLEHALSVVAGDARAAKALADECRTKTSEERDLRFKAEDALSIVGNASREAIEHLKTYRYVLTEETKSAARKKEMPVHLIAHNTKIITQLDDVLGKISDVI